MKLSLSVLAASLSLVALTSMAQPAPAPAGAPHAKPVHAAAQVPSPDAVGPRGSAGAAPQAGAAGPRGDDFPLSRALVLKRTAEQFDAMDTNRDGQVTREEMQAFREKMMQQFSARQGQAQGPGQGPRGDAPAGMDRPDRRGPPGAAPGMTPGMPPHGQTGPQGSQAGSAQPPRQ